MRPSFAITSESRALAPVQSTAVVLHGIAGELEQVRDLARTGQARFTQVTDGKGTFLSSSKLQRVDTWLAKNKVTEKAGKRPPIVSLSLLGGVVAGLGLCLVADLAVAVAAGSALAVAGSGLLPAARGVRKAAANARGVAAEKLIPLDGQLASMIERFKEAGPGEKAVLGQMLQTWLAEMTSARALEPEARAALQKVDAEVRLLPADHQGRARQLRSLASIIDDTDMVTPRTVSTIRNYIDTLPAGERHDLATAVAAILKKSGRTIDYQAKHDLFDLVENYAATASPAKAAG